MLKDNLTKKLAEHTGLTRNMLARKAGISQASFSQIMTGAVKNPGVYTVAKIAKELNCSVDELAGRTKFVAAKGQKTAKQTEFRPELALNVGIAVLSILEKRNKAVGFDMLLDIISAAYKYFVGKNSNTVDEYFVAWFLDYLTQNLENKQNEE